MAMCRAKRTRVEWFALQLHGAVLLHAAHPLAGARCASGLGAQHALAFGTQQSGSNCDLMLPHV